MRTKKANTITKPPSVSVPPSPVRWLHGSLSAVEYQLVQTRAVACLILFFSLSRWAEPLVLLWATSTRVHFPSEGPATDAEGPVNSVGGIKEESH